MKNCFFEKIVYVFIEVCVISLPSTYYELKARVSCWDIYYSINQVFTYRVFILIIVMVKSLSGKLLEYILNRVFR